MTERLEQRYCIKFCQKLEDSKVETIRKIRQAFGDDAMGAMQIKEWYIHSPISLHGVVLNCLIN
jgi:hypothetical protein